MIMGIAALLFIPLLAVSMAHFIWGIGKTWPIRDEKLLARTVVGAKGIVRMPHRLLSLGVSIAALAAGVLALSLADPTAGGLWLDALGLAAGAVFLARGVVGYMPFWAALTPEEPFRTLDRKNYSPLCIGLGIGFVLLVILRLI